jgi:hypothetical protein
MKIIPTIISMIMPLFAGMVPGRKFTAVVPGCAIFTTPQTPYAIVNNPIGHFAFKQRVDYHLACPLMDFFLLPVGYVSQFFSPWIFFLGCLIYIYIPTFLSFLALNFVILNSFFQSKFSFWLLFSSLVHMFLFPLKGIVLKMFFFTPFFPM